ncbi:MAG: Rieske (2Fe-2S) protein [Candidatus Hydrogenedentes bacterium]|nr:Rieske (2Fe-2S) protein [Candidatus Hydrogenedentota bacterium]
MGRWVDVARRADLSEDDGIAVDCEGRRIAVFNAKGRFFALSDACPHMGGPLSDGWVDDGVTVTCPRHGWKFDLERAEGACDDGIERYPVRLNGERIEIELPD